MARCCFGNQPDLEERLAGNLVGKLDESGKFELTPNEMRVAASIRTYGRRRYRILYVPFVVLAR